MRPKILSSRAEFPTVAHVWLAQQRLGAEVIFLDDTGRADEIVARYTEAVDERTALVSVPSASYLDGRRFPVGRICKAASAAGCSTFVDCYQTFAVEPLDLDSLGCEYAAAGAAKYLTALPGIAFLYSKVNSPALAMPLLTGRRGRRFPMAFNPFDLDWAQGAQRFETGTQSIPSVFAAVDAVSQFAALDLERVRQHVFALVRSSYQMLTAAGERFATIPSWEGQAAHLTLIDPDPAGLTEYLARNAIIVSPRGRGIRLSFHLYNDEMDIVRLAAALAHFRSA
jgi:selenocysteine lyase/cysteine desulfurase